MAIKRVVSTAFWEDGKVIDNFTPEDKYFFLYLLTNPHTKQIGIYPLNPKQASFETGYSVDTINSLLERFEKVHKVIKRSTITNEIAIVNYLCYSVVKGGSPVVTCLNADLKTIRDKSLVDYCFNEIKNRTDLVDTIKNYIKEYFNKENANDNDNDNDNDNECTSPVRSPYEARTKKLDESKFKYTELLQTLINNLFVKEKDLYKSDYDSLMSCFVETYGYQETKSKLNDLMKDYNNNVGVVIDKYNYLKTSLQNSFQN